MSAIESVSFGQLAPLIQNTNVDSVRKAQNQRSVEAAIETTFLQFMINNMDFSKTASVLSGSTQPTGDAMLMNQMIMKLLLEQKY